MRVCAVVLGDGAVAVVETDEEPDPSAGILDELIRPKADDCVEETVAVGDVEGTKAVLYVETSGEFEEVPLTTSPYNGKS